VLFFHALLFLRREESETALILLLLACPTSLNWLFQEAFEDNGLFR